MVLKTKDAFGLIPALFAALLDADGSHPGRTDSLEIFQGSSVTIDADPAFELEFDGEVPGLTTPISARVLKSAVRYVVSPEGYDLFKD